MPVPALSVLKQAEHCSVVGLRSPQSGAQQHTHQAGNTSVGVYAAHGGVLKEMSTSLQSDGRPTQQPSHVKGSSKPRYKSMEL